MAAKGPKKKESKDVVGAAKDNNVAATAPQANEERFSAKKKIPIPLWPEWTDQDIGNEKWESGKKEKDRGRSPTANLHYFDDPDGKVELPSSLHTKCKYWKRPVEILDELSPVVVNSESVNDAHIDLISSNDHLIDSELMRNVICVMSSLYEIGDVQSADDDSISAHPKTKSVGVKDTKDTTKVDKSKKEVDCSDGAVWKPWDLIWPKENSKPNSLPLCNPYGKYAVKLFWMGCYRKIIVDDLIPCDEAMKPLFPFTCKGNELWPMLLTKALIKVASLDYNGGEKYSEIGEVNFIHCLTGWLPEPIPLDNIYSDRIWNLLMKLLPNWKYPQPKPKVEDDIKVVSGDEENNELHVKESNNVKGKKDDKTNDKKQKLTNDHRTDPKVTKEKGVSAHGRQRAIQTPEVVVFASFPNISHPSKLVDMKEMADSSEKLRKFGLSNYFPHPVHINLVRNLPLIPPPPPTPIPRWKLIRQKKKKDIVEPPCHLIEEKSPQFLELKSPYFNYKFHPLPLSGNISPCKWEGFKPLTPLESLSENIPEPSKKHDNLKEENPANSSKILSEESNLTSIANNKDVAEIIDTTKRISISSNSVSLSPNKSTKRVKSSKERKATPRDGKNIQENKTLPDINTSIVDDSIDIISNHESRGDTESKVFTNPENKMKEQWIDFHDFCQCFQTLWIYHKPKTYNKVSSDTKIFHGKNTKSKKSSSINLTPAGRNVLSPTTSSVVMCTVSSMETSAPFLLVDCLRDTEIVFSLSSFSQWFDTINVNNSQGEDDNIFGEIPVPGTLVVEPYSWKKIMAPSPLMKISTTSVKAAVLNFKPGRHVMHLLINAPLGYDVTLCSTDEFLFGDENVILQQLTNESCRFIDHSVGVMKSIGEAIQSFHASVDTPSKQNEFLIGTECASNSTRMMHFETLFSHFTGIIKKELDEGFTDIMSFSMKALKYELLLRMANFYPLVVCKNKMRPSSLKCVQEKHVIDDKLTKSLPNIRLETQDLKDQCASKIQALFRGYFERKLKRVHEIGSKDNILVDESLQKIWSHIETNLERLSIELYRSVFKEHPSLFSLFPFHSDEWNKITFADYNGVYTEQPTDTWFVVFREIFYIPESILMTCKMYCPLSNCIVKVIGNDTGYEIKTLFTNILPQILHKNSRGYSFIALAFTGQNICAAGKFRLRIIADKQPLPYTPRETVNSSFVIKEIKDYYVPNYHKRIFRYTVKVSEDLLTTLVVKLSNKDVDLLLQVLDGEKVIYVTESKGEAFLPAVIFYRDRYAVDEKKSSRPPSQAGSTRSSSKVNTNKQRPPSSRRSLSPDKSKKKSQMSVRPCDEEIDEDQVHKYIIEAYVLNESWPLTKTEWRFIESLKMKDATNEDENESQVKVETSGKNSAGKSRKTAGGKDSKTNRSRPESQLQNSLDLTKSHWELQCIVDTAMDQNIEIKKDSEREDEVKAIKTAWEAVEPGRAAKAQIARQKFLEKHMVRKPSSPTDEVQRSPRDENEESGMNDEDLKNETSSSTEGLTSSSPIEDGQLYLKAPKKESDIELSPFDITQFIKSTGRKIVLNDTELERIQSKREHDFENFYNFRDHVLGMRENDRIHRNSEKEKQLIEYEELQAKLDAARHDLQKARLTYRNKFIEQPEIEVNEVEATDKKKRTPSPKRKLSKAVRSTSKMKKK